MPISYKIRARDRITLFKAHGDLNRTMMEAVFLAAIADPSFDPGFDTVADFTDVEYLDLSLEDVQALARLMLDSNVRFNRYATVTGPDQGRYSLGVLFTALSHGLVQSDQRIFRTMDEANAWLTLGNAPDARGAA